MGEHTVLGIYADGKYTELTDEGGYYNTYDIVNNAMFYLDEFSSQSYTGTLMLYKNGRSQKIDADVYSFDARSDDYIVYIKDFSTRRNYGDLYYKKGNGKPVKVDNDVSYIITLY